MKKGRKKMNNYYLTDEDIHGCEENETETILRIRLKKAEERIKELEEIIDEARKILRDINV